MTEHAITAVSGLAGACAPGPGLTPLLSAPPGLASGSPSSAIANFHHDYGDAGKGRWGPIGPLQKATDETRADITVALICPLLAWRCYSGLQPWPILMVL